MVVGLANITIAFGLVPAEYAAKVAMLATVGVYFCVGLHAFVDVLYELAAFRLNTHVRDGTQRRPSARRRTVPAV